MIRRISLPKIAAYRLALDHFMENAMRAATLVGSALIATFFLATWPFPAPALTAQPPEQQQPAFTSGELVGAGQQLNQPIVQRGSLFGSEPHHGSCSLDKQAA